MSGPSLCGAVLVVGRAVATLTVGAPPCGQVLAVAQPGVVLRAVQERGLPGRDGVTEDRVRELIAESGADDDGFLDALIYG